MKDRSKDILNSVNETLVNAAQKTYKGQKRSDLKDSDFLFPATRSFPIVTPQDIPDAISNFGRMKGKMSYDAFLKKLYNMAKRKGPEFVAALPKATKDKLNIKTKAEDDSESPEMEMQEEMEEYKNSYYGMSVSSIRAIANHATDILNNLDNPTIQENLTAAHLQGMIAVAEDNLRNIHDFVMFSDSEDDDTETESKMKKQKNSGLEDEENYPPNSDENLSMSESRPGLWENIRKKKEKMGKRYKPAKPGDKDRPDPEQWKRLTK